MIEEMKARKKGAMKKRDENLRGGKVKKKHLRSSALKLFHLMVLKGIDG